MRILKRNPVSDQVRERARELRKASTTAEKKLWRVLRAYKAGVKFRRQYPVGPYIADFYSPDLGLVIELDGDSHASEEAMEHDRVRDEYLRSQGLTVRRYTNGQVMNNLDGICRELSAMMESKR